MMRIVRRQRPATRGLLAALALTLAVGLGASTAASSTSHTHDAKANSDTKPTVVLVHGSWADSSGWAGVITRLHDAAIPSSRRRTRCAGCPPTPRTCAPS